MKVAFVSLGCAKNLVNTEQMMALVRSAGHEITAQPEGADAAVLNTCGFIDSAKSEAIQNILELAELKKEGKLGKLLVTGCLSQRYQDELMEELPEVDGVMGTGSYTEIVPALEELMDRDMGFACGLLAMILVPVMSSMGANPTVAHHWAEGYNLHFAIFLGVLCLGLTVAGFFFSGRPAWAAWAGYRRLLRTTGRAPSDYLRMFGPAPVLINMGVNGLIGMAFILATGGDLNGPTLGGILTIMGFSAFGKHARNITPIMLGVVIGGVFMHFDINQSSVQLALLFGTTLAPISGYFGWPFGIVAVFLHSSVVLHAGTPVEGINLYNNGFSGGLLAIVLYPIISEAIRHHRPGLQDRDYFDDTIEHDEPLVPPPARRK